MALLHLAEARGVEMVAKGVESREQVPGAWPNSAAAVGFFFSKPLAASGMAAVLRRGTLPS